MRGIYILVVSIAEPVGLKIGAMGRVFFKRGLYAYVGSGQIGLQKRIARHLTTNKNCFWHIDYLLTSDVATVVEVFWKEGKKSEECRIAGFLGERGLPIVGFGCSDCRCRSHLFKIIHYRYLSEFMNRLCMTHVRSVR